MLQTYPFIASFNPYSVVPGASFFITLSIGLFIQHSLYGGGDDPDFLFIQTIEQRIKLSASRGFPVRSISKEKLIHGNMIPGNQLKEYLEAWMLSLVLNIGKITGLEIHFVSHLVAGFLAPGSRFFDCRPEGLKIVFLYWSFSYIHSPSYILLFLFSSGYVYIVPIISQYNSCSVLGISI